MNNSIKNNHTFIYMSKSLSNSPEKIEPSLVIPIYKVKLFANGSISTIFVFNCYHPNCNPSIELNEEDLEKLNEEVDKIFTDKELQEIRSEKIAIKFSKQHIHFDDSIGSIKAKILNELKNVCYFGEIYLYCQKIETFNSISIYKSLTQNNKLQLTKIRLDQFLSNIVSDINGDLLEPPIEKDVYTYDDIFEMNLDNKQYIVNKVLGQKFFIVENEYPFICDPYNVNDYDKLLENSARKSLTTLNSHLLLNSGEIVDNSIYLCLANDVLTYLERKDVSEETTLKIYFPFLYNKHINTLDELENNAQKLIEENRKLLNEKTFDTFKTINMFYDVYKFKKNDLNYLNKGIKYIKAILKPEFEFKMPLEIIFKILHASQDKPLIKYNPSTRQENIYRLFADQISTDGRKIPFLKKAIVFKLMKTIARNKSVAIYIESIDAKNISKSLICEIDEEGFITITSEFTDAISIDNINDLFTSTINPIITEINNFLEQSGYKLNKFTNLNDSNVEIKQLTYETQIRINKPFKIDPIKGCISSIFINETNKLKGNAIHLRFKRVSNYSKFTAQEAFILEKSEQGLRGDQIIESLLENFPEELNRQQAIEMVRKVANEMETEKGIKKTDIKLKDNPGFKTIIVVDQKTEVLTITTENINNIYYLQTLPIYLDTMVRLTQDKKSTKYDIKELNKLCSAGEKTDIIFEDKISLSERAAPKSKEPSIDDDEDEEIHYKKIQGNKPTGALSLFFDEEEPDESSENLSGGNDSGSSISSEETPSDDSVSKPLNAKVSEESSVTSEEEPITLKPLLAKEPKDSSVSSEEEPSESQSSVSSKEKPSTFKPLIAKEEEDSSVSSEEEPSESQSSLSSQEEDLPLNPLVAKEPISENNSEGSVEQSTMPLKPTLIAELPIVNKKKEESDEEESDEGKSDDDSSSQEENESDEEQEANLKNIDGMKLNKPYYFQMRIEEKDPRLILKEDHGNFNSYVRTCSSNLRKQPVILTDKELEKINEEHPGFLREEDVIKYGSDPKNQFNYICPRYWCLKNNTLIDPNELTEIVNKQTGKKELLHPTCGKVLPKGEKKVKPGYYIYEFYKEKSGNKDYKKYPGLIPDSHPDGLCLPCCFEKYNTIGRIKANKKCLVNKNDEENKEEEEQDEYIKGPDKFPLGPGRWGFLPVEMQTMLHEANVDCQISKTNTMIKENYPCLLRHGIEINNKQSFIACISDVIFFGKKIVDENNNNVSRIITIKEMKERIIKSLTIDKFIKYQNGNLVNDFHDINKKVDLNEYNKSFTFLKLNMENPEEKTYFLKVVTAYKNFIDFLKDDEAIIDHTYLWDIICIPNKYLFPNGVNLVIFELPKSDITNNVQLLCPTNHYSDQFYEARKPTIILIKEDGYYEPIYSYSTNKKKISIIKEFKEFDPNLSKTLKAVFKEIIKPFFNLICKPLESMPNVYKFKRSLILTDLVQKLDRYDYKIKKFVINFNNKVIGVVAEDNIDKTGFIPCYPSALSDDIKKGIEHVFMTDLSLWNTYENTIQFLNRLDKRSKKRRPEADIPCKPVFKIIEEEHVVGILTNTNQFIQLSQPIRLDQIDPDLDIPSIDNANYFINAKESIENRKIPMIQSDVFITTQNDVDRERVDYIKKIKLETDFYNVFRNTIRILINNYENVKIREEIERELSKAYVIYSEKLRKITELLHKLVKDKIHFTEDENFYKTINEVSTCIVKDKNACLSTPQLCVDADNGHCNLILPEKNLITKKQNEQAYYGRMADELIRYSRIKSFMLKPQSYLSFSNVGYNLRDNEIILIQSLLTQEYFENLIPMVSNKYIHQNSYDNVEPIITQIYDNKVPSLDHAIGRNNEIVCHKNAKKRITSSIWKPFFPETYTEVEYSKYNYCTFDFIIDLIEKHTGQKTNINQIKNELIEEYKKYLDKYFDKIVDILILEGKKTLGDQVRAGKLSFSNFIYTDNYFLTTFDLWLLVTKYKIPTIFICQKWILQTNYNAHEFVGYGDEEDSFAFIIIPGFRPENVPGYKIVQTDRDQIFVPISELNNEGREVIKTLIQNKISIEKYLEEFTFPKKTNYPKKKPVRFVIESDSEEVAHKKTTSSEEHTLPPKKQTKKLVTKAKKNVTKNNERKRKLNIEK